MSIDLTSATAILHRTPDTLDALLRNLPEAWTAADEGPDTWSAFDIVGHLVHGERADWIPRARIILDDGEGTPFPPFDRHAQERESQGKNLPDLLDEFRTLRRRNLETLDRWRLTPEALERRGTHPDFGGVTLSQLIATWAVHDLSHLSQIARVMARQYDREVGPWKAYLRILQV